MAVTQRRSPRRPAAPATDAAELARVCARVADDKKAEAIVVLDLSRFSYVTDYFVIASGTNPRQLHAISGAIQRELRERGVRPIGVEGATHDQWILIDFGDIVVHLFDPEYRQMYDLELLWGDAPRVKWEAPRRRRKTVSEEPAETES